MWLIEGSIHSGGHQEPFLNFHPPPPPQNFKATTSNGKPWQLLVTVLAICCHSLAPVAASLPFNANGSELNLEAKGLEAVPSVQLCSMMIAAQSASQINVVSLANNRISKVGPNSFQCSSSGGGGEAAFTTLRILVLRNNEIELIEGQAFVGLGQVQVLLLDNNRLRSVPSIESMRPLQSLRHLNLANNKIESLDDEAFGSENANLISLNLNANPLHRISANSLVHLSRLKTLTISQSALSGQLTVLKGLTELRFYHLDRGADLRAMPWDLCQNSRKLSSLVLKLNQLELVPMLEHCQNLLLLDLSYNRIRGSISENFTRHPNMIDLYLGHNQIEIIDEAAFKGLGKLQVLALDNNNLKHIHPRAFLAVRSSLFELNLANNPNLSQLHAEGLDLLVSLKAYGNLQLRELPPLKSATQLALTYAYHCCDYLSTGDNSHQQHLDDDGESLIMQLLSSALENIRLLWPGSEVRGRSSELVKSGPDNDTAASLTELIIWPQDRPDGGGRTTTQHRQRQDTLGLDFDLWQADMVAEPNSTSPPEAVGASRRRRAQLFKAPNNYQKDYEDGDDGGSLVIDELLWEAKQIRLDHSVRLANNQIWPSSARMHRSIKVPSMGQPGTQTQRSERNVIEFWSKYLVKTDDDDDDDDEDDVMGNLEQTRKVAHGSRLEQEKVPEILGTMLMVGPDRRLGRRDLASQMMVQLQTTTTTTTTSNTQVQCLPKPSPFFPCQDLFDTWWLRTGVWCVFLSAFTGNILVIVVLSSVRQSSSSSALTNIMWLAHSKRHIDVPRFLVINLAVADLIMALYLGILAFVDLSTLGKFKMFAIKWQYSSGCKLAGFLAVLSSELSIFILAIITLERNYAITNAVHLNRRLSLHKAMVIMFFGYAFAFAMAILPLNGISDYRKFSICLPLDMDSTAYSHMYVVTLVSINSFSFILLLSCYLRMYCAIRGSQAWNTNDLRIAKRMSILVVTDFLCWSPIIVVALGALFGHHLVGPKGLKVLTIFILPLNSVANPFLYAITTKKFKRDLMTLLHRLRSFIAWLLCSTNTNYKDPNAYVGYNQYQRNMMILIDKKKRYQGKGLGGDHHHCGPVHRGAPRHMTRTAAAQTANQVTMNRTTCSCRRLELAGQQAGEASEGRSRGQNLGLKQTIPMLNEPPTSPKQTPDNQSDEIGNYSNTQTHPGASHQLPRTMVTGDSHSDLRHARSVGPSEMIVCAREQNGGNAGDGSRLLVSSITLPVKLDDDDNAQGGAELQPQRHLLSVSMEPKNRPASACGFSANDSTRPAHLDCDGHPEARASGSYDTMRTVRNNGNSLEKLSRSINRLLFHPVAKAWSSIQISIHGSATQLGTGGPPGAGPKTTNHHLSEEKSSCSVHKSMDSDQIMQDSTTMDDLLMQSGSPPSGARNMYMAHGNERRMSRSCDYISFEPNATSILLMSPSSSGHEPTTSHGDYDDDQRILLATIDRIAANKVAARGTDDRPSGTTRGQFTRNRCTRCRSWSPALLGKLEDCIYQIKCKIPGLVKTEDGAANRCPAEPTPGADCCRDNDHGASSCLPSVSPVGTASNDNKLDNTNEDDRFDVNSSFGDNNIDRCQQRGKPLRQQFSANSDTLSTRTGGTIVTNTSSSFDSTTNIPFQCSGQQRSNQGENDRQ